jgi:ClpP class serine protease
MHKIFSRLPRIADAVFCQPWMIQPEFHQLTLVPQLLSAVENPARFTGDRAGEDYTPDPHAKQRALNDTLCAVNLSQWLIPAEEKRAQVAYNVDANTRVAQLYVNGIIGKALDGFDMMCGGVCVDHIVTALEHLAEFSPSALALHFNSPGGTVTGVAECAQAIRAFTLGAAPVHAFTDSMCASAAYWMACAADSFTAADSSVIGSIGVYCALVDSSQYYQKEGIFVKLISSGVFKGQGTRGVPINEEYVMLRKQQCADCADRFFAAVIEGRGDQIAAEAAALPVPLPPEEWAAQIMQGQWWYAQDAPAALRDGAHSDRRAHLRALTPAA